MTLQRYIIAAAQRSAAVNFSSISQLSRSSHETSVTIRFERFSWFHEGPCFRARKDWRTSLMAKKKPTVPKKSYQLYQRRVPDGDARPEQWWINNAAHYDLVAHLSADSMEEACILTRHQDSAWYRQPDVTLVANAPVRTSLDGDVLVAEGKLRRERQTWMLIAGSAVLLTEPQEQEVESAGQQQAIVAVCWSPDGKRFAACGLQGLVRVHALGSPRDSCYDVHGYAQSVAWSPDGKRIATGDGRDATHIWDVCPAEEDAYGADAVWGRILICRERQEHEWFKGTYAVAWSPGGCGVLPGSGACLARGNRSLRLALSTTPGSGAYTLLVP